MYAYVMHTYCIYVGVPLCIYVGVHVSIQVCRDLHGVLTISHMFSSLLWASAAAKARESQGSCQHSAPSATAQVQKGLPSQTANMQLVHMKTCYNTHAYDACVSIYTYLTHICMVCVYVVHTSIPLQRSLRCWRLLVSFGSPTWLRFGSVLQQLAERRKLHLCIPRARASKGQLCYTELVSGSLL